MVGVGGVGVRGCIGVLLSWGGVAVTLGLVLRKQERGRCAWAPGSSRAGSLQKL